MKPFLPNLSANRSYFPRERSEDIELDHDTQSGVELEVSLMGTVHS